MLEELVKANAALTASVATLTKTNETLTKTVERLSNTTAGGSGGSGDGSVVRGGDAPRDKRLCRNCKRVVYHFLNECFELKKNAAKRPPGWKSVL